MVQISYKSSVLNVQKRQPKSGLVQSSPYCRHMHAASLFNIKFCACWRRFIIVVIYYQLIIEKITKRRYQLIKVYFLIFQKIQKTKVYLRHRRAANKTNRSTDWFHVMRSIYLSQCLDWGSMHNTVCLQYSTNAKASLNSSWSCHNALRHKKYDR